MSDPLLTPARLDEVRKWSADLPGAYGVVGRAMLAELDSRALLIASLSDETAELRAQRDEGRETVTRISNSYGGEIARLRQKLCPHGRFRCACLPNYGVQT